MSETKVSWLRCIGRLVSKMDEVMKAEWSTLGKTRLIYRTMQKGQRRKRKIMGFTEIDKEIEIRSIRWSLSRWVYWVFFKFFYISSCPAKSWQDPVSIDIEWSKPIECQSRQDPPMIWQEITNCRKTPMCLVFPVTCWTPIPSCPDTSQKW